MLTKETWRTTRFLAMPTSLRDTLLSKFVRPSTSRNTLAEYGVVNLPNYLEPSSRVWSPGHPKIAPGLLRVPA
jgi:hypothetical protein